MVVAVSIKGELWGGNVSTTLLSGGNSADSVIRPFVVNILGGMGKEALGVVAEFSKVAHPGDDEDPTVRKARAIYRTRLMKRHAFALARLRYHVKVMKYELIRDGPNAKRRRCYQKRRDGESAHADACLSGSVARLGDGGG